MTQSDLFNSQSEIAAIQERKRKLEAAREARDEAIERVAKGSGDAWQDAAMDFLRCFIQANSRSFFIEEIRDLAEAEGLEAPPDRRAWGAVAVRAARAGLIRRIGYGPQASRNAHMAPKSIWIRCGTPRAPGSRPA